MGMQDRFDEPGAWKEMSEEIENGRLTGEELKRAQAFSKEFTNKAAAKQAAFDREQEAFGEVLPADEKRKVKCVKAIRSFAWIVRHQCGKEARLSKDGKMVRQYAGGTLYNEYPVI